MAGSEENLPSSLESVSCWWCMCGTSSFQAFWFHFKRFFFFPHYVSNMMKNNMLIANINMICYKEMTLYFCGLPPQSPFVVVVVQSFSCVWFFVIPMDCSTPGLPVLHHLSEFSQTPKLMKWSESRSVVSNSFYPMDYTVHGILQVDLPDPGIELGSPALQMVSLPTEISGKPV